MSNSKTKKQNIPEVDMISNFPDSLLSHILSFVPTKQVVATSILSKRWINVWTLVNKFVSDSKEIKHFRRYVYRVLKLHEGNIKDLRLRCYRDVCSDVDVISWIITAISRGVQKLDVCTDPSFRCPLSIFSCEKLVDLKISILDIANMSVYVAPIFPYLKKVHISFLNGDAESFKHIVSQCSTIEHLIVHTHMIPRDMVSSFEIIPSSMKWLEIHSRFNIALGVSSLEYLHIDCVSPPLFEPEEKLSSLVEANISFCYNELSYCDYS